MTTFYLIAGEASGDLLGAGLMRALKARLGAEARFMGVGGERMAEEGLSSLFPYHELSLMGFAEVLPHIFSLSMRIQQVAEDVQIKKPAVIITIDSPGFNFRVIKKLRQENGFKIPCVHYVAPSVWAYKPRRAKKCAKLFDHMLVLLPFEPPYFEKEGLKTTFVGHPVAYKEKGDSAAFRAQHGLRSDDMLLALLPGSREKEIERHMPIFAQTVVALSERYPQMTLAVPVSSRLIGVVGMYFQGCPLKAILIQGEQEKWNALAAANAAIVKSGTVSLEVAQAGCPQIVTYRTSAVTAALLRRWIRTPYVNLINIISGREVIPELLQERCTPYNLAHGIDRLLADPGVRAEQLSACAEALASMRAPGGASPHELASEAVLSVIP